ncbi:43kDa postsynaptic protein [Trema orientale]|uniref:43kDa postsynaptic protein n=1 Tax=Trema orientale TaxID=63057 RepID=A0A2P5DRV4_TREOI|nr:43kDa postsynaptic protein [Trema orientale]
MGSDSIACNPTPLLPKDLTKKKRTNRVAKLKQSKLDVRREQWLSQVKTKGCKVDSKGRDYTPPSMKINEGQRISMDELERRSRGENEGSTIHHSDLESFMSSQNRSIFDPCDSLEKLGESISSSSSSHCCSGSVSEEEADDGCLDDWEAFADAINASEIQWKPFSNSPAKPHARSECIGSALPKKNPDTDLSKVDIRDKRVTGSHVNSRAWRADDAFRPQCLPNLSNQQHSFPTTNSEWHEGSIRWASSCPICYEDLDVTDSSFLPCSCGFRLCLFCHKQILEADGRCPGCRKQYDCVL